MSLIQVSRGERVIGHFTAREVAAGLADGSMLHTDTAWTVGRRGWAPLAEWPEFSGIAAPAAAPAITAPALPDTNPAPVGPPPGSARVEPEPAHADDDAESPWERDFGRDRWRPVLLATLRLLLTDPGRVFADRAAGASRAGRAALFLVVVGVALLTPARVVLRLSGGVPSFWASADTAHSLLGRVGLCFADLFALVFSMLVSSVAQALVFQLLLPVAGVRGVAFVPLYRAVAYTIGVMLALAAPVTLLAVVVPDAAALGFVALVIAYAVRVVGALRHACSVSVETAWGVVLLTLLCCGLPLL